MMLPITLTVLFIPYLHLLREESIEKALEHYKGDRRDRYVMWVAREKGPAYMKMLRNSCL